MAAYNLNYLQHKMVDKLQHALKPKVVLALCALMVLGLMLNGKMTSHFQVTNLYGWMQMVPEEGSKCHPRSNIVFLKTHKCASSTVQNVIMRFGDLHNLTFVLPDKGNYLGHPKPFHHKMVPDPKRFNLTYNILTHHSRLNYPEMRSLMPQDSVFVTIVRDPVDLYESLYSYYNLHSLFKQPLKHLLKSLTPRTLGILNKRLMQKIGRNQMSFDLGFDSRYFDNSTAVVTFIRKIDSIFDLVMIAEKMEESLVLLKNLMCWNVDDVVVFRHNARSDKFKSQLDVTERAKLKIINLADQMLYDYFVRRLNEKIKQFGELEMANEVAILRNRTQTWYGFCVSKEDMMSNLMPKGYRANNKVMGFQQANGSNTTCSNLIKQELPYTDYLRKKQRFLFPPPVKMSPKRLGYRSAASATIKRTTSGYKAVTQDGKLSHTSQNVKRTNITLNKSPLPGNSPDSVESNNPRVIVDSNRGLQSSESAKSEANDGAASLACKSSNDCTSAEAKPSLPTLYRFLKGISLK